MPVSPPQNDHFAASPDRSVNVSAVGALVVVVWFQLSVAGIVFPASVKTALPLTNPPHTIISLPGRLPV